MNLQQDRNRNNTLEDECNKIFHRDNGKHYHEMREKLLIPNNKIQITNECVSKIKEIIIHNFKK